MILPRWACFFSTHFVVVDTTKWRFCNCNVRRSCFCDGVMLEICWVLPMVVVFLQNDSMLRVI